MWKWEELTEKQRQKIRNFDSREVIIRTSHESDWEWMVDVMPTIVCTKNEIDKTLTEIKQEIYDPEIIKYSKKEGTNYNPDEVSISIAPYIEQTNFTLTEHPNQEWKIMLDLWREEWSWINKYVNTQVIDFLKNQLVSRFLWFEDFVDNEEKVKWILELHNKLRNLWFFAENRSLQIEWWIDIYSWNINLYQIRDFAENKYANFRLEWEDDDFTYKRIFWVTWPEGIKLPIVKKFFRWEVMDTWEELWQEYLWFPETITNKLSKNELSEPMKWYIPWNSAGSVSLAHQNTRLVKDILNKNWVAILENPHWDWIIDELENWDNVRVISDWVNYEISKI